MRLTRIAGRFRRNVGDPNLQINIIECRSSAASPVEDTNRRMPTGENRGTKRLASVRPFAPRRDLIRGFHPPPKHHGDSKPDRVARLQKHWTYGAGMFENSATSPSAIGWVCDNGVKPPRADAWLKPGHS